MTLHRTLWLLWLLALAPGSTWAQHTEPERQLPPSMRIELAKEAASKHKTIIFRDTLKSAQQQSRLLRDTSRYADSLLNTVKDSALATIDSAVAEPTMAHLDSAIAELPEFSRDDTLSKSRASRSRANAHFEYPLTIMTESYRNSVPFDSTVLRLMNPISRENLPYFDQHPIPLPLKPVGPSEGYIQIGAGTPHLPTLEAGYSRTLNERWALGLQGNFIHNIQSDPIQTYWNANANLNAELGDDPAPNQYLALATRFATSGKQLTLYRDTSGSAFQMNHLETLETLSGSLSSEWAPKSTFNVAAGVHLLSDNSSTTSSETSEWMNARSAVRFGRSDFGLQASIGLDHAGPESTTLPANLPTPSSSGLLVQNYSVRLTDEGSAGITWNAGINVFAGSDISGVHAARLFPSGAIQVQLTPDWSIGGSFDPRAQMMDHAALIGISPFFSPVTSMEALVKDSATSTGTGWRAAAADPRRVRMDKLDLTGFTSYTLSADDEVHASFEIAQRSYDVAFFAHRLDSASYSFFALPETTDRFSLVAGTNLLFFTADIFTLNFEYNSVMGSSTNTNLPFEPELKMHANYRLNSLSDVFKPSIEFDHIGIPSRSFSFLNLRCDLILSPRFSLLFAAQNILGSASDYWTGYNELPRSIWGAINLKF